MFLTVHTPIALIIGSEINSPLLAFILGTVSHFVLDLIPHDPEEMNKWQNKSVLKTALLAMIDLIVLAILLIIINQLKKINFSDALLAALIGAIWPDFIWGLNELTKGRIKPLRQFFNFHHYVHQIIHKKIYIPVVLAIIIQILVFAIPLFFYFYS